MPPVQPNRTTVPPPRRDAKAALLGEPVAGPIWSGTWMALFGLFCTGLVMFGDKPATLAQSAAYGAALSLSFTLAADLRHGIRNLLRPDVLAIVALYMLTLFEFLFPQPEFNSLSDLPSTHRAIVACLWGMAAVLLGRHIRAGGHRKLSSLLKRPVPSNWLIVIFISCLALGILHMLVAVKFDFMLMLEWCTAPRFTQPWTRGRLGNWASLLNELAMLLYLIPPIAGIAYARRSAFNFVQTAIITAGFALVLFMGFASGTRNLFIAHLLTFLFGYVFALRRHQTTSLIVVTSIVTFAAVVGAVVMLQFRNIGLKDWMLRRVPMDHVPDKLMHVDMNLYVISQLVATFPDQQDYLGFEVPYLAMIRPIPRALWPGKPEGLSVTMEESSGAEESWTVAASFVGEAYIAGGMVIVVFTGLLFGFLCRWWGQLASPDNSEIGIVVYASGFFAAAISMRSLFVFTTAILPTIAAILLMRMLAKRIAVQASRWLRAPRTTRIAPPRPGLHAPPRRPRG